MKSEKSSLIFLKGGCRPRFRRGGSGSYLLTIRTISTSTIALMIIQICFISIFIFHINLLDLYGILCLQGNYTPHSIDCQENASIFALFFTKKRAASLCAPRKICGQKTAENCIMPECPFSSILALPFGSNLVK